ncbi:MAG: hypothetical protein JXR77_04870 [Lentisphaeria bacterium]|nr:hypothetical protein [Lentisphaeria bacterium]
MATSGARDSLPPGPGKRAYAWTIAAAAGAYVLLNALQFWIEVQTGRVHGWENRVRMRGMLLAVALALGTSATCLWIAALRRPSTSGSGTRVSPILVLGTVVLGAAAFLLMLLVLMSFQY